MRKRNEVPVAFNCKQSPINKKKSDKVDHVHIHSLTEHERALEALAMMKEIEAKRKKKMVTVQVDERTSISAEKNKIEYLVKAYKKN